ncbi:MAG: hypothetical protein JWL73_1955 [Actinomycetia bacterium]|nr:hypothetical protein [Actinomycetes bacterium]
MVNTRDRTRPSADYLALVRTPRAGLAAVMRRGDTPDINALTGWEWRGTNMPATSRLLGLRRFIKGFAPTEGERIEGYNVSVSGADLSSPWKERRQRDGRREWAEFTVTPIDPAATDNRYLHALLLDYGAVAAPEPGIAGRLRDYLVRVVPGSDELLLAHAFAAFGQVRVPIGWFVLERLAPVGCA